MIGTNEQQPGCSTDCLPPIANASVLPTLLPLLIVLLHLMSSRPKAANITRARSILILAPNTQNQSSASLLEPRCVPLQPCRRLTAFYRDYRPTCFTGTSAPNTALPAPYLSVWLAIQLPHVQVSHAPTLRIPPL